MNILGERLADLVKAYQEMNLWRIPRMEVDSPTLLVYKLDKSSSAALIAKTGYTPAEMAAIGNNIEVHLNNTV